MTIKIEKAKNRIKLRADRPIKKLNEKIPGANFARTGGAHWTMPLTMDNCRLLREHFKKEIEIGPDLRAWALARTDRDRTLARLGKAKSAQLAYLQSSGYRRLYEAVTKARPYQSVGARFIVEGRLVIIADTVGLGKTLQTLAAIVESRLPGPHLVVCPKTAVASTWRPEIEDWLPEYNPITCPDHRAGRDKVLDAFAKAPGHRDIVIVNQDMLRTKSYWVCRNKIEDEEGEEVRCGQFTTVAAGKKELACGHDPRKTNIVNEHEYHQLFGVTWSVIVADESDKCLLRKTKLSTQTRRGMEMLKLREDGIKVAQSATPWRSRPHLLWSTLNWLYPDEHTTFWGWVETMYTMKKGFADSRIIDRLNPERERMLYKTLNSIMLRRTKQEVAPYLPRRLYIGHRFTNNDENSPVGVWLPMTKEQARAYKEMEDDAVAEVRGGEIDAIGALAELTRLQQLSGAYGRVDENGSLKPALPSNKFDYLCQILAELGFPDDPQTKVVVVSKYTALLDLFAEEIKRKHKVDSLMLTGKVSSKKRAEAKDIFNDPDRGPHLMFMNTKAGGSSITLDAADEMIFLDETFVADDQEQCEGRIDNRRPEEKVVQRRYRYLRSIGTVEVGMAHVNAAASEEDRRLLDERRGVQYVIDVLEATFRQNKNTR